MLLLASLGLPRVLALPGDLAERLAFAVRADLVLGLWVMWAVRRVAKVRFESAEDNAGSAFGPPGGRLALATVGGEAPLAYILAMVALFSLGRVAFLRGYP